MANLTKTSIKDDAKIFLTDYASYNNGSQFEFGHWVDLSDFDSADELNEYISEHFEDADKKSPLDSPREEIMITDFEGFPKDFYFESMDFKSLFEYFERADQSGYDTETIEAFADLGNYDIEDIDSFFDALEESYQGAYDNDEDFVQQLLEDTGCIPTDLLNYIHIDWQSTARDIIYDYYESNGHYFRAI